jgi:hypothetical protein
VPDVELYLIALKNVKKAASLAATLLLIPGTLVASERLETALESVKPVELELAAAEEPKAEEPEAIAKQYWVCKGCTDIENRVLRALQDEGITDKVALAVVMGNIQQESRFQTNICEGGVKTGYHGCHRGGFGLIQWTTVGRYNGLGATARGLKLDPNSIDAQLAWMFKEPEWKAVVHKFRTPGQSMSYYMNAAYRWLGWGIHGARTSYAQKYVHYLHFA